MSLTGGIRLDVRGWDETVDFVAAGKCWRRLWR
jgi:hypothetical protein